MHSITSAAQKIHYVKLPTCYIDYSTLYILFPLKNSLIRLLSAWWKLGDRKMLSRETKETHFSKAYYYTGG
jgi:hypothetical protein